MPAYTASKFALAGWTDAIRPELADLGIHVAQIHPGAFWACEVAVLVCTVARDAVRLSI